jgi:hypothetical protein
MRKKVECQFPRDACALNTKKNQLSVTLCDFRRPYHILETVIVVYEEQIPPPILFANFRMMRDHLIPHRS